MNHLLCQLVFDQRKLVFSHKVKRWNFDQTETASVTPKTQTLTNTKWYETNTNQPNNPKHPDDWNEPGKKIFPNHRESNQNQNQLKRISGIKSDEIKFTDNSITVDEIISFLRNYVFSKTRCCEICSPLNGHPTTKYLLYQIDEHTSATYGISF